MAAAAAGSDPMNAPDLPPEKVAEIHDVFKMFDTDDSGDIDVAELKMAMAMLDPDLKEEEVEELMAELDVDGNGTIEFDEFLVMMTRKE